MILEFVVYRDPTGCLTAFCFSPFEVRDDSNPSGDGLSHLNRIKSGGAATTEKLEYWTMYFDGSLMIEGAGAGIMLISPTGERLKYVLQIHFPTSNNAAEYEALLHGLCITILLGIRRLVVRGDSELVINPVQKEYSCTSTKMSAYC